MCCCYRLGKEMLDRLILYADISGQHRAEFIQNNDIDLER